MQMFCSVVYLDQYYNDSDDSKLDHLLAVENRMQEEAEVKDALTGKMNREKARLSGSFSLSLHTQF